MGRRPIANAKAGAWYQRWEEGYLAKTAKKATCRFLDTLGGEKILREFALFIELDDETARAHSHLPLP